MDVPREEYAQRTKRIREAMLQQDLQALLIYSWKRGQVRYISGYVPNYIANTAMAVLPLQGEPALFIRFPFDLERAQAASCFTHVHASGDVGAIGRDVARYLRQLGLDGARIGLVSGDSYIEELPYTLFQELRSELPAAAFQDARELVMGVRLIKSAAELQLLKRCARIADAALQAGQAAASPGNDEYAITACIEAKARSLGAESFLVSLASRANHELVGPPETKAIEPGAVVVLEVAVQVGGYWTQAAHTLIVGAPSVEQRAIYAAVHRAYHAAADLARPGRTVGDVFRAAYAVLEAAGYGSQVEHDAGHGVGLDLPEPPRIEPQVDTVLAPGMALVIHPAVRVPGVGAAFLGGTVLVTSDGSVPIHSIAEDLP